MDTTAKTQAISFCHPPPKNPIRRVSRIWGDSRNHIYPHGPPNGIACQPIGGSVVLVAILNYLARLQSSPLAAHFLALQISLRYIVTAKNIA